METTKLDIQYFHTSKATHKDFHVYNKASDPDKYTITGLYLIWGLNVEVEIYTNPTEFGNYMVKSKFEGYELISFEIGIDILQSFEKMMDTVIRTFEFRKIPN